jgi:hypothetical protein
MKILPSLSLLHTGLARSVAREKRDKFTPSAVTHTHTPVHFSWSIDHGRLETYSSWITFSWVLRPIPLYCHSYARLTITKCCKQNTETDVTAVRVLIEMAAYFLILWSTCYWRNSDSFHKYFYTQDHFNGNAGCLLKARSEFLDRPVG